MRFARLVAAVACAALLLTMVGCSGSRTIVSTNTSDESYEMRREGEKTAISVDPGGSARFRVRRGNPVEFDGFTIQVY